MLLSCLWWLWKEKLTQPSDHRRHQWLCIWMQHYKHKDAIGKDIMDFLDEKMVVLNALCHLSLDDTWQQSKLSQIRIFSLCDLFKSDPDNQHSATDKKHQTLIGRCHHVIIIYHIVFCDCIQPFWTHFTRKEQNISISWSKVKLDECNVSVDVFIYD